MTLDQFIANETGKKHLIPGQSEVYRGQCVQLIGVYLPDVFGEVLPIHPNAKDYWTFGIPGFDKVPAGSQQKGDITVYNGHGAFPEGHIAISLGGNAVFEENADPDGSPAHVFNNRSATYLLGALRKGGDMPLTDGQLDRLIKGMLGREPTQEELANPDYHANPGLAIETFWNNGGQQRYQTPPQSATVLKPGTYKVQ